MFTFAQPFWFLLALFWPLWFLAQRRSADGPQGVLGLPTASALAGRSSWRIWAAQRLPWLAHLALAAMMVALARPQKVWNEEKINSSGIDIVLAIDISPSMLSRDFKPNRLAVTKQVAIDFVQKRPNDRIGVVAFSKEAFTLCPLTPDKRVTTQFIQDVRVGVIEDGTAIGDGLITALNRLKSSTAKTRIVVLLTDGDDRSDATDISPEQATQVAEEMGIKTYTIAIGEDGVVEAPYARLDDTTFAYQYVNSFINTALLEQIAARTKARFFRAYSPDDLTTIYGEIDRLEKTKIDVTSVRRHTDFFMYCLGIAFGCIALLAFLAWVVLRRI